MASSLELLGVPQEGGSAHQVAVAGLVLALLHLQHVHVNSFLVDVAAALIVVNEGERGGEGDLSSILNSVELADRLGDAAFVEDAKRLPESKFGILTLVKFLQDLVSH